MMVVNQFPGGRIVAQQVGGIEVFQRDLAIEFVGEHLGTSRADREVNRRTAGSPAAGFRRSIRWLP